MILGGLQKLTLLDFPGTVACTVFTVGCNLRCPFCHNPALVFNPPEEYRISEEEFFAFLNKRKGILDGVAITGGEPTLMPYLPDFMAEIHELGYTVKLDTNGTRPEVLRTVIARGLVDYVAMDIKNSKEKYGATVGFDQTYDLAPIEESISVLMENKVDFEFRTTVSRTFHTPDDIRIIGEWLAGQGDRQHRWLLRFLLSGSLR